MTNKGSPTDAAISHSPESLRPKHLPLIGAKSAEPPVAVPARMLNEVLYCERLMYLEWVQREFKDNYFTVDGRNVHTRADAAGGRLPELPRDDDEGGTETLGETPYRARSVWLTSESLGITAKIDIVEGDESGNVVPIEYKRGAAPDVEYGAYIPERVQLCAHVLLLREQGYSCDHAEIYFARSNRRVPIEITDALIEQTLFAAKVARQVATMQEAPPPLVDSPKCRG